jgi:hypothetical protein
MLFGFDIREKKGLAPLTEEAIRSRLYGSAVGISVDTPDRPSRDKKIARRRPASSAEGIGDDMPKIHDELAVLRSELEQAKRRLKKIKGINTKRLRSISVYAIIFFMISLSLIFVLINVFFLRPKGQLSNRVVSVPKAVYTVQVAVSERLADAENFKAGLEAKGYKPFIHKSTFVSGKDKFTIYAGEFNDKGSAGVLMNSLRSEEGMKDSFVINMPK